MDLLQLHYFRVVARREHMTKAAEELFITQPSLSKTIRRLEQELGVPLFDRHERSLRLNQFGKVFLEHVETLFTALEKGQHAVRTMAGLDNGAVSLITASTPWLPEFLRQFQDVHPSIHVRVTQCSFADLPQQLETGEYDFGFFCAPPARPRLQWHALSTEEILLVVPPSHRLAEQHHVAWAEIAHEAMVLSKVGSGLRTLIDRLCQQENITLEVKYEVEDPEALFAFVKAGFGIGFVPALMGTQVTAHDAVCLHLTNPFCTYTPGIAWQEGRSLSQAAQTFRHFISDAFADRKSNLLA